VSSELYLQCFLEFLQDAAAVGCTALNDCGVGYLDPKGELGAIYGTLNKHPIMRFTGLLIPARASYW
jgi:hypothetical protein